MDQAELTVITMMMPNQIGSAEVDDHRKDDRRK